MRSSCRRSIFEYYTLLASSFDLKRKEVTVLTAFFRLFFFG